MYASSCYRKLELKKLTRDRQSNQSKWHLELQQVQSAPIFPRFWWYGGAKLLNMQRLPHLWPSRLNPSWMESWKINPRKVRETTAEVTILKPSSNPTKMLTNWILLSRWRLEQTCLKNFENSRKQESIYICSLTDTHFVLSSYKNWKNELLLQFRSF